MKNDKATPRVAAIVGIGASAGGLEALKDLLSSMPLFVGAAYVVVQHLAPEQYSILHELLQSDTKMPVTQIKDGVTIEANHVYVAPPGTVVSIDGNFLHLTKRDPDDTQHRPIDRFFTSLAAARGRDAYCVILSGTGSDGSAGLRAIKGNGGFAFAQESSSARFSGMPDNAVATGLIDFTLPASYIPSQLSEIIMHRQRLNDNGENTKLHSAIIAILPQLSALLLRRVGHDFSNYKPGTLVRRIERRMSAMRITSVKKFLKHVDSDIEAELLAQEFMIGVTQFFRDGVAFDALKDAVVRPLLERADGTVRIWVPGCSTGEEVYTLAMLFIEEMEEMGKQHVIQIFGTDIDMPSLVSARYGAYSTSATEKLSSMRRKRFFVSENGQCRVVPKLREMCVFTPHNLLQDPPFSRLDLISCRNLLIYLSSDVQKTLIPKFHFSLRESGYLFLGSSESISEEEGLFYTINKQHRVFQKNNDMRSGYSSLKSKELTLTRTALTPRPVANKKEVVLEASREATVQRDFLRSYAAPFALLSGEGTILYLSQQMTRLVQPTQGPPSTTIDGYLAQELRLPVRTALSEAIKTKRTACQRNIAMINQPNPVIYDVTIGPCGIDYILILTEVRPTDTIDLNAIINHRSDTTNETLEAENVQLRSQLTNTLQDAESSGQDLKSINEELMSMNEELQSSNEELETSREELQSINEELETVNAELQENNRLLVRANSDLKNLFEATDVAVLFLDREFCVRSYTPSVRDLFGIKDRDIGRPVVDLSSNINYEVLLADAADVDQSLQSIEREIAIEETKKTYLLRTKPYRTTENHLDGYALSFVDITQRKEYERSLETNERAMSRQYAELANLYETTPVGLALMDRNIRWVRINESLAQMNGFPIADHIGKTFHELLPDLEDFLTPIYNSVFDTGEPVLGVDIKGETAANPGVLRHWVGDFYPVFQDGHIFAAGACVTEVTEQTRMVEKVKAQNDLQKLLMGELQHRVKNTLATISSISKFLLQGVDDPEVYQQRLEDRLLAISRTHDVLTSSSWTNASFSSILQNEAKPYQSADRTRVRTSGPDIDLSSEQTLSVGMAIHELITNAAKYGALSVPEGTVYVTTAIVEQEESRTAVIEWEEYGGPKIAKPPTHSGFGSLIINRVLKSDLGADVAVDYHADGLKFRVKFPLKQARAEVEETG